eukprot:TRINITY_DN3535_c1_g1_i1.p1 TRINITY_DN3535_c1_g1~~TRINITY_DN3535_c1_g1_i1.p1  ORF type:complete len:284 (-),score=25.24 TRINITY_DN3535_c1_g1_i1:121-972(-)
MEIDSPTLQGAQSATPAGGKLIKQGAEARVFALSFHGKPAIVKERFVKKYRHPTLDTKLTQRRLNSEARCMAKCAKGGIDTPTVYLIDHINRKLYIEFIDGKTVRERVAGGLTEQEGRSLSEKVGKALAAMHDLNVVHGDLTTSNMMLRNNSEALVLIDFGLSYVSSLVEDKGVDLYVLERAFLSTHPNSEKLFESILQTYEKKSKHGSAVIKKLSEDSIQFECKLRTCLTHNTIFACSGGDLKKSSSHLYGALQKITTKQSLRGKSPDQRAESVPADRYKLA